MSKRLTQEGFIASAIAKHGTRYDYSQTVYRTAHEKITIICPIHGAFEQKASAHLKYGCKQCGNARSGQRRHGSVASFMERANEIHCCKYNYSLVSFDHQHQKIDIVCPFHGLFQQPVNDHLKGRGCHKCGNEATSLKRRGVLGYSTEEFIKRAIDIHGTRYEYDLSIYRGNRTPVTITCREHGQFQQGAYHHLKGDGCLKCRNADKILLEKGLRGNSPMLFDEFERRSRDIHGDKYNYKYFTKLTEDVGIECQSHGLFMQKGNDHLYAQTSCPSCARKMVGDQLLGYTQSQFEMMLTERWEDEIWLTSDYHDFSTLTTFSCFAHGEFSNTPDRVLSLKGGCPQCWQAIRGCLITRYTQTEFEILASKTHHGKYQYGTYYGIDHKMQIECPLHGIFMQNSGNHLSGYGCPSCGLHKTAMQNQWLNSIGIKSREIWLTFPDGSRIKADGYDPNTKTVYEFWGDFRHGNPRLYPSDDINRATGTTYGDLYQRTLNKRKRIVEQGLNLIEIWEQDWRRINEKAST